ncbi:Eco57I restriction-modification methylase domain-containing protein [Brachyspira hyodysenteriae]|nr:Eco57I restriction-modification methylase domain-containing protein [Brachyspira hyodysenteriae]MCZ9886294.1 Eco57I restriction-modification methylase domain-containing protein [Brachyspira hyodysenteriae]
MLGNQPHLHCTICNGKRYRAGSPYGEYCGNSLIGNDFYESHLDLDDDTLYKINCFDWNSKFRDIMKAGGFDVVIGNPPYVQIQGMEKELKEGYKEANYKNYVLTGDIYQLFLKKFRCA